jgi:hypothetical protein
MIRRFRMIFPVLLLVLTATAVSMTFPPEGLQVGAAGMKLYPRWNKAFKPLVTLEPGEKLTVLRDRGAWKEVEVDATRKKGWIYCDVKKAPAAKINVKLSLAASPTTSGLVVKGWSAAKYAAKNGTDIRKVGEIMARTLDFDRFNNFKQEGGLK